MWSTKVMYWGKGSGFGDGICIGGEFWMVEDSALGKHCIWDESSGMMVWRVCMVGRMVQVECLNALSYSSCEDCPGNDLTFTHLIFK